ncbi:hypothetical protein GINT2_001115 [Glugoides intestinalis]
MEDDCEHAVKKDGICIECGFCTDDLVFRDQFTPKAVSCRIAGKFTLKDPMKINEQSIKKILVPLNLERYSSVVKELLHTVKFTYKLSKEDKILIIIFNILKSNGFPISTRDLLKYSSMTKARLLKAHRDTFGFSEPSKEYLLGVYERTKSFLESKSTPVTGSFGKFIELVEINKNTDPHILAIAYFFEKNGVKDSILKSHEENLYYKVQNTRRKLKKLFTL